MFLFLFLNANYAQKINMKLGNIKGESTTKGYEDQIAISSFSHAMSKPYDLISKSGKSTHGEIVVSKRLDLSSAPIMTRLNSGQSFSSVEIAFTMQVSNNYIEYLKYTLENAVITSYSITSSDDPENAPNEEITIFYERIKVDYKEIDPATNKPGQSGTVSGVRQSVG